MLLLEAEQGPRGIVQLVARIGVDRVRATGLTFGSISALFGYNQGYIDQAQYSILVTVVVASAVIPTVIAQLLFQPKTVKPAD